MKDKIVIFFMIEIGFTSIVSMATPILYIVWPLDNNSGFVDEYLFSIQTIYSLGPLLWFIITFAKILLLIFLFVFLFSLPVFVHALIMKRFMAAKDLAIIFDPYLRLFKDKIMFPIIGRYYKILLLRILHD